ncbi:MAG: phosphoadenosine phosphosulfate reductase family protein, partial [Gemmatimonadota bacterium]|nr:phosphoadenosine phosphosulfate reductase family protein [Gemmatimonadota bacterium]
MGDAPARHILSLSGGKDSSALAIYMRDRVPDMEYVFCDTGKELPETYAYLDAVEAYLGKAIVRLNADRDFDHWHSVFGGFLPSAQMRWCTKLLKLKPFEAYVGDEVAYSYIAIRADEDRTGYISHKPNLRPVFPFKEDGIKRDDVFRILRNSGLGMPPYYEWGRSRSGCFFCFFQQKVEWVRLLQRHPALFEEAKKYEKLNTEEGTPFTWTQGETLEALSQPER